MKIKGLTKYFPGVKALDNIDLEICKGEVHALVGENGAGKSTLIKVLVGVYREKTGEIYFNNRKVNFNSPSQAFENGMNVIYQENSLVPHLSVIQNVFLGTEFSTSFGLLDEKKIYQEYVNISEKYSFHISPYKRVRNLGVAEQKLVEILKALVHKTKFIIMDEPTASLSKDEVEHLFKIISELKSNQVSVLYITHILEEVFNIADRITVLRDGKKIKTTPTKEVNQDELISMMVGESFQNKYIIPPVGIAKKQQPILEVQNLLRKPRVNGISFSAFPGEILGVTGLNGAGKTELCRVLFGADKLESGKILIENNSVIFNSPQEAVKQGISLVPEDRKEDALFLMLELYKNITLPTMDQFINNGLISLKKEFDITKEYIKKLNIKTSGVNQLVKYLSGGNQQKVAISKWLQSKTKVLILDEPTQGIDVKAKREIYNIIVNLAKTDICIIFSSSDVSEVVKVSSRILVLSNGEIISKFNYGVSFEEVMKTILTVNRKNRKK